MSSDPSDFFDEIASPYYEKNYEGKLERYRDFQAVFLEGNAPPERCKRVLWEILAETGWFQKKVTLQDNILNLDKIFMRLGKQDFGLWLYSVLTAPPDEPLE